MRPNRQRLKDLRAQTAGYTRDDGLELLNEIDALTNALANIKIYGNDAYKLGNSSAHSFALGKSIGMSIAALSGVEITPEKVGN